MDASLSLAVILRAVDHLSGPVRVATGAVNGLAETGRRVSQAGERLAATGLMAQEAGRQAGGLVAAVVGPAADFEQAISRIRAHADAPAEAIDRLSQAALRLGAATQFDPVQAAAAMDELAKQGFTVDQILAAAPHVLNMAAAGEVGLARAATIASEAMHQFNLPVEQMPRIADVLVAAANGSATSLDGLAAATSYAGTTAHAAGLDLESTAAMVALLSNAGIDASRAGTTLNSMLARLASLPKPAADALEALGVETRDGQGNLRNIAEVLADVDHAMQRLGYGSGQVIEAMQGIFGLEHIGGGERLTEMVGTGKFAEMLNTLRHASGISERTAATLQDNFRGWEEQLRGSIMTLRIFAGTLVLPTLTEGARRLTQFVNRLTEFAQAHPQLVRTTMLLVGIAAAALGIGGPVMLITGTLTAMAGRGVGAAAALGRGLMLLLGPIGGVAAAIGALGLAGYWVWEHWDNLAPALAGIWTELADVAAAAWAGVVELIGFDPVAVLRPSWEPVAAWFGRIWTGVGAAAPALTAVWDRMVGRLGRAWQTVRGWLGRLWDLVSRWGSAVGAGLGAAVEAITARLGDLLGGLATHAEGVAEFFAGIFTLDLSRAAAGIGEAWQGLRQVFEVVWSGIRAGALAFLAEFDRQFGTTLAQTLPAEIEASWQGVAAVLDRVGTVIRNVAAAVGDLAGGFAQGFGDTFAWPTEEVTALAASVDGLSQDFAALWEALRPVREAFAALVAEIAPADGPMRDWAATGREVGQVFGTVVAGGLKAVVWVLRQMIEAVRLAVGAFRQMVEVANSTGRAVGAAWRWLSGGAAGGPPVIADAAARESAARDAGQRAYREQAGFLGIFNQAEAQEAYQRAHDATLAELTAAYQASLQGQPAAAGDAAAPAAAGQQLGEQLASGIAAGGPAVATETRALLGGAVAGAAMAEAQAEAAASGQALAGQFAAGIRTGEPAVAAAMADMTQAARDFLPHSPAKVGPLSDLDRLQFGETIAASVRPAPLVAAMQGLAAAALAALPGTLPAPALAAPDLLAVPVLAQQAAGMAGALPLPAPDAASGPGPAAAAGDAPVQIVYQPQITIQVAAGAGGDLEAQVLAALRRHQDELVRLVEQAQARGRRVRFGEA